MAVGLLIVVVAPRPIPGGARDGAAAVVAVALGAQNAVVRALAVPDLTTTVLTMTMTGLVADATRGLSPAVIRRLLAVTTMFVGAVAGALLVLRVSSAAGLGAAAGILLAVAISSVLLARGDPPWHRMDA